MLAGNTWLDEPMFPVYKPQRVAAIDKFLIEARGRFGGTPIPHTKLTRELLRRRSETHVYAMVADQTPVHNEAKYWTTFLHQDTAFFVGADAIARILQAAVVFVEMQRVRRGYYTMNVSVIAEPPYDRGAETQVVEHYVRALEAEIRTIPRTGCGSTASGSIRSRVDRHSGGGTRVLMASDKFTGAGLNILDHSRSAA